ncbi:MAG: GNAT family N-acetyltransferase [Ilumatobacteraceae bacterium]|nr:GNAT family N-acetyltransferase [Ilumatobacteraceae bacterium]
MSTSIDLIRPGVSGDVVAMTAVHHRCWMAKFAELVTPREAVDRLDPNRNLARFADWLEPGSDARVTVAERDGKVVGYSTVVGNELLHLFVDPDHAGCGIGRTLLAAAESQMSEAGHRTFELHTMVGNVPAIGLYESAGWQVTDRVIHSDDDHGVSYDEHVLLKHLT